MSTWVRCAKRPCSRLIMIGDTGGANAKLMKCHVHSRYAVAEKTTDLWIYKTRDKKGRFVD